MTELPVEPEEAGEEGREGKEGQASPTTQDGEAKGSKSGSPLGKRDTITSDAQAEEKKARLVTLHSLQCGLWRNKPGICSGAIWRISQHSSLSGWRKDVNTKKYSVSKDIHIQKIFCIITAKELCVNV